MAAGRVRIAAYAVAAGIAAALIVGASSAAAQSPCRHVAVRSPFSGESISGTVPILGSAQIDSFLFYKLEYAPSADPESWRAVSTTIDKTVRNGLLDTWNSSTVPDGPYRLKLTVVDQNSQEPCRVIVNNLAVANGPGPTPSATVTAPAVTVRSVPRATSPPPGGDGASDPGTPDMPGSAPEVLPPIDALDVVDEVGDDMGEGDPGEGDTDEGTGAGDTGVGPGDVDGDDTGGASGDDAAGDTYAGQDTGDAVDADVEADVDAGDAPGDDASVQSGEVSSDGGAEDDADDQIALGGLADSIASEDSGSADESGDPDDDSVFATRPDEPESAGLLPEPSTLAQSAGVGSWPAAFCGGVVAMLLLMVFAAAVLILRRSS